MGSEDLDACPCHATKPRMDEMLGGDDRERMDRVTEAFLQMKKIDTAKLRQVYEGQ
jgi:hypothetical protein